jgi:hypothetical protein
LTAQTIENQGDEKVLSRREATPSRIFPNCDRSQKIHYGASNKGIIEMTDLIKTASSREQNSHIAHSEIIAMVAIVVLLVAVQGMYIAKHTTTLNVAARSAAVGIIGP